MLKSVRVHLTYSNVVSTLCLFLLLGGAAYAAASLPKDSVRSKQIKAGAVKSAELAKNAVSTPKVKDGSLLEADFAPGQLPEGPQGPQGEPGADGSPDTPAQVRDKLLQVDGSGSGVDADTIDGIDSGALPKIDYSTTVSYDAPSLTSGTCDSVATAPPSGDLHAGDSLIVTPNGGTYYPLQFSGAIRTNVGFIYANVCNNGPTTLNEGPITINLLLLR